VVASAARPPNRSRSPPTRRPSSYSPSTRPPAYSTTTSAPTRKGNRTMFRRLLRPLLACALLPLFAVVGTASPAVAASCATAGHAYVIQGGGVYMSGYEGNYQNGVQYLVLTAGTPFQVGANGVKPDNFVTFELVYGETTYPFWQPASQKLIRLQAGGTCV